MLDGGGLDVVDDRVRFDDCDSVLLYFGVVECDIFCP